MGRPLKSLVFTPKPDGVSGANVLSGEGVHNQTVNVYLYNPATLDVRGTLVGTGLTDPATGAFSINLTGLSVATHTLRAGMNSAWISEPVTAVVAFAS